MNKKILISILIACVLLAGSAFAYPFVKGALIKSDPVNHLLYATMKSSSHAYDMSFTSSIGLEAQMLKEVVGFSEDPKAMETFIQSVLGNFEAKGQIQFAMDPITHQMKFYENILLAYQEDDLISLELGYLEDMAFIRSKELYGKALTMSKSDLTDLLEEELDLTLKDFTLTKYIDLIRDNKSAHYKAFMKNQDLYLEHIRALLKDLEKTGKEKVTTSDGKSYTCDTLSVAMDFDALFAFYVETLNTAKNDEHLKALVKEKVIGILELMKSSSDYAFFDLSLSEVDEAIASVEADFDKVWAEAIDEIIYSYQLITFPGSTMVLKVAIDSKYQIRAYSQTLSFEGVSVSQKLTVNAYGNKVLFNEAPKFSESLALKRMMTDTSYATDAAKDFTENGLLKFLENSALERTLEDIKKQSEVLPAAEHEEIVYGIDGFLEQMYWMIGFLNLGSMDSDWGLDLGSDDDEWDWNYDSAYWDWDLKRVGAEGFGFVDIPSDWDEDASFDFYIYTSPSADSSITLHALPLDGNAPEDIADAILSDLEDEGYEDLLIEHKYFAGFSAIAVSAFDYNTGNDFYAWVFDGEDDLLHVIVLETTGFDFLQYLYMIEDTFYLNN